MEKKVFCTKPLNWILAGGDVCVFLRWDDGPICDNPNLDECDVNIIDYDF